jgi:hypothetical protein
LRLQGKIRQATIDLDDIEAALRLFDPEVDMAALSPRKVAQVLFRTFRLVSMYLWAIRSCPVLGSKLPKASPCYFGAWG